MLPQLVIKSASAAVLSKLKPTKRDAAVAAGALGVVAAGKRVASNMAMAERMRAHEREMKRQQRKAEGRWL